MLKPHCLQPGQNMIQPGDETDRVIGNVPWNGDGDLLMKSIRPLTCECNLVMFTLIFESNRFWHTSGTSWPAELWRFWWSRRSELGKKLSGTVEPTVAEAVAATVVLLALLVVLVLEVVVLLVIFEGLLLKVDIGLTAFWEVDPTSVVRNCRCWKQRKNRPKMHKSESAPTKNSIKVYSSRRAWKSGCNSTALLSSQSTTWGII